MNTLKIEKELHQTYNIYNEEKYNKFIFSDKSYDVYSNVNLSIFVDKYCNYKCPFCVADQRQDNRSCNLTNEDYLSRLKYVLDYIEPLNPTVSLTGGEPTKSELLIPIIKLLDNYNFKRRTITTNGSGLLDKYENKLIIDRLIEANFNYINISRLHYDESINRNLVVPTKDYLANKDLEYILKKYKSGSKYNSRIRLSTVLLKEGVNSVKEISNYINYFSKFGQDSFIFRQLMLPDRFVTSSKKSYTEDNFVALSDIYKEFGKDFELYKEIHGYYYTVKIFSNKGNNIATEYADLAVSYSENENHKDLVYEMVFHPNGNLTKNWQESENILMKYNTNEGSN